MCNVSLREEGVDLSHSCRQQSVSICVSLREEGVDLSARWTMSVQPIYVSLREEGVELSIWRKSPSSQSTVVSLREEGVDLSPYVLYFGKLYATSPSARREWI